MTITLAELQADMEAGTKGPWGPGVERKYRVGIDASNWADLAKVVVAMDSGLGERMPSLEGEANLRRIARLPDTEAALIEAVGKLKRVLSVLGDAFEDEECDAETQLGGYIFGDVMQDAYYDARALLAKLGADK